jgi:murein L,D-transpeptidase YcbB/YkuD
MEGIDLSELFDTRLYDAEKEFQALHGLKKSGDIDKQTWNRMAIAYGRSLWAD